MNNFIPLFVAICCSFLGHFGPFDLSDRCLVYFSVIHDPFGQYDRLSSPERIGVEKQFPLEQTRKFIVFEREQIWLAIGDRILFENVKHRRQKFLNNGLGKWPALMMAKSYSIRRDVRKRGNELREMLATGSTMFSSGETIPGPHSFKDRA